MLELNTYPIQNQPVRSAMSNLVSIISIPMGGVVRVSEPGPAGVVLLPVQGQHLQGHQLNMAVYFWYTI